MDLNGVRAVLRKFNTFFGANLNQSDASMMTKQRLLEEQDEVGRTSLPPALAWWYKGRRRYAPSPTAGPLVGDGDGSYP